MTRRLIRGGVTLYALMLSVIGVAGVGMALVQAGQAYAQQQRNEQLLRARMAAEAAIAIEDSNTNLAEVAAAGTYTTTIDGIPVVVTSTVLNPRRQVHFGERVSATATLNGRSTTVDYETGKRRAGGFPQWQFATHVTGSDRLLANRSAWLGGLSLPDFATVAPASQMNYASLTFSDFNAPVEIGPDFLGFFHVQHGHPSVTPYDLMIATAGDANPDFSNLSLQISRGTTRTTITNLNAHGSSSYVWAWGHDTYRNVWRASNHPAGTGAQYRVVLIDLDAFTNGTAIKTGSGELQVTLSVPNGGTTTVPSIDSVAFLGPPQPSNRTGWLAEYSSTWSNGFWPWANLWDPSVPDEVFLRRTDQSLDIAMGSTNPAVAVGALTQYWHICFSAIWTIPQTGTYRFGSNGWSDNGYWLWIDDTLVFDSQSGYNPGISLVAGQQVRFWLEQFDGGGWYGIAPRYTIDGGAQQSFIPAQFRPAHGHQLIYANNFDTGTPADWTWNGLRTTAGGADPLPVPVNGIIAFAEGRDKVGATTTVRSLGDFGGTDNWAELAVGEVPAGRIILHFDLNMHASWDGTNAWGPDNFTVTANGTPVFDQAVANWSITNFVSPTTNARMRGGSWGFGYYRQYRNLRIEWTHGGGPLNLRFASTGPNIQVIDDESWSLDNVVIRRKRGSQWE